MAKSNKRLHKTHIVIVGAGFGGLAVARKLRKNKRIKITLVNDETSFRYSPGLYRAAIGYRRKQAIVPLKEILEGYKNLDFVQARVLAINRELRFITTSDGQKIHYDYAVLALGVVTNYFGIPGLERYSYGIKSAKTLDDFHSHLHSDLAHNHKPDRNYVVVGAGPTGTELSAGLVTYLKKIIKRHGLPNKHLRIEVIERADRVLPTMHPKASKIVTKRLRRMGIRLLMGQAVMSESEQTLRLADRSIPTRTVVWTAGTANNPFFKSNASQFNISERGKVVVNEFLEVDERLHVIGDNIEGYFSGLAQMAVKHGHYTAKALQFKLKGKNPSAFKSKQPTYVVPVGKNWSVMQKGDRVFAGWHIGIIRSLADLIGYADILGAKKAYRLWLMSDDSEETCEVCKQPAHMDLNKIHLT